jgi:hypothetical protein
MIPKFKLGDIVRIFDDTTYRVVVKVHEDLLHYQTIDGRVVGTSGHVGYEVFPAHHPWDYPNEQDLVLISKEDKI